MKLIAHLIAWFLGCLIFAALLYWYGHLWMPRLQVTYWAQAFPVALITTITLAITGKTLPGKALRSILGIVLIVSAITQALVWVSLIPHPQF